MLRGRDPTRAPTPDVEMRLHVRTRDDWTLDETPVPQARPHDLTVELLRAVLEHWARSARPGAQVTTDSGARLRVADDRDGANLWPTAEERERAEKAVERAAKVRALAELDRALARIAELEDELRRD